MPVDDGTRFDPKLIGDLNRVLQPVKRLLSPIVGGLEHVPRTGGVLLVGNHTLYGLLDIPLLGLAIYEETGRAVRGLADHNHFALPVWRDFLRRIGGVRGTRETCGGLLQAGEAVLVFPGGGREVFKRKGEKYRLIWKERVGFARMAIAHGAPIVPVASVGVEDMFEILVDANDVLASPVGALVRALGIMEQPWFRRGEIIPPVARGTGPGGIPRLHRQYFLFGAPIDATRFAGRHDDPRACHELRDEVKTAVERGIAHLCDVRDADPERYPVQRLLRRLAERLG